METTSSVSIIMPVYNEEKYIENCLTSILKQSYSNIIEVLIIDGFSEDSTRAIVEKLIEKSDIIHIIDNKAKTPANALNKGITMSKGDIIIRVDAHALYREDYVFQCVKNLNELKEKKVVNVGGPTLFIDSDKYIENCIIFLHQSKFGIGVAKFRDKNYEGYIDTVWNGAFFKWIFDVVGLYNVNMNRSEDNDMNKRILESGYKIYQSKSIVSNYFPRNTVSKVVKQNYGNGRAIGGSIISNLKIVRLRHLIPLFFICSIIISVGLSVFFNSFKYVLLVILLSYLLVDFIESIRISIKNGLKYLPTMVALFFTLHIAYGVGTIIGLLSQFRSKFLK